MTVITAKKFQMVDDIVGLISLFSGLLFSAGTRAANSAAPLCQKQK